MKIGVERLAVSARAFLLLALALPALWERHAPAFPFLLALGVVMGAASWYELRADTRSVWPWLVEAALVGGIAAVALAAYPALLAALALPPFLSGLRHGRVGAAEALAAELVCVVGLAATVHPALALRWGTTIFTWTAMGLGVGLVAGHFHAQAMRDQDSLASYRAARGHLAELVGLSEGLSSGLDPLPLGREILAQVLDGTPAAGLTLHVRRGPELTPLIHEGPDEEVTHHDLAAAADAGGAAVIDGQSFAFPLLTDSGVIGVVTGSLSGGLRPDQIGLRGRIERYPAELTGLSIRLDTALLFAAFRDTATVDERRRLAREMHDGIAQDIASMGYLVDALVADPAAAPIAEQLTLLRHGITTVVAEVRRSVLTLRSQVGASESLGAAIGSVARHLSAVSGMPIQVTSGEGTTRLLPEVEAELMRIAQEAMNNAVKHARASVIDVRCHVEPPAAEIVVSDDGRGLQDARLDSHGLEIMRERARLIGAELVVASGPAGGTQVVVRLPGASPAPDNTSAAGSRTPLPRPKESVA